MSKNLITKFRKFWRTLSPLEQGRLWNIITALRGEDDGEMILKEHTTARIRGLLFGSKLQYKGVKGFFKATPYKEEFDKWGEIFLNSSAHFRCHIGDAIRALKPYVKKEKFKDLLRFIGRHE